MEKILPFCCVLHTETLVSSHNATCLTMEHLYDDLRKQLETASYNVRLQLCQQIMTRDQYNTRINNFFAKYSASDIDLFSGTDQDVMLRDIGQLLKFEAQDNFSVIKSDIAGLINFSNQPPKVIFFNVIGTEASIEKFFVGLFTALNATKPSIPSLYPVVLTLGSKFKKVLDDAFGCNYSSKCQIGLLI
ncbi:hypothetical protein UA32_12340 [Photobacterium angustum]|uniref:Uncharacterized protein n=1 Tax=Photobacterium angustum TaxID=661 RepID=A0ABX5GZ35_PHOAN|nr:hypothetical protein [Photobacterium angustum]KJG37738.1 hypothetical protein UA32_12340 [Photobacterium angustum]PSX03926.1 hypothetical protein C0W27_20740 [Photobacterium angustum]